MFCRNLAKLSYSESWGGSRNFFRRGAPLRNGVTNTNKPLFFQNTSCTYIHTYIFYFIWCLIHCIESVRSSRGGGCAPPAPSPWSLPCFHPTVVNNGHCKPYLLLTNSSFILIDFVMQGRGCLIWVKFVKIDQFRYIKVQPNTVDLSTRLWEINFTNSVVIPQRLVQRSAVLD